ncbi:hypothetical protein Tco_1023063 [Tanacetum coccineum]
MWSTILSMSFIKGPSTPPSDSSRPSRNAECSNYKLLLGKIKVGLDRGHVPAPFDVLGYDQVDLYDSSFIDIQCERHEDVKFAIRGLCIDDSLAINARRRADSFVVFRY